MISTTKQKETDAMKCTEGLHLILVVEGNENAAPDTHVVSYCVTEA